MKGTLVCFAMVFTAGLLISGEDEPKKVNPDPPKPAPPPLPSIGGIRFLPTPIPLAGESGDVNAVAFSPDGKRVANVGGTSNPLEGFVAVLDVETKKELFEVRFPQAGFAVAYSSDGKYLAVSAHNGFVRLLEADTGKQLFALRLGSPARVCFAPDGKMIATVTESRQVQIWDVPSGEERTKLRSATGRLTCIAFSPDGKRVAAGGAESAPQLVGRAFVWDVGTERVVAKVEVPGVRIHALAFAPDSAVLATGGSDGQAYQWGVPGGKQKSVFRPKGAVLALAYSPDGRVLATGTAPGAIILLDPASGEETGHLSAHTGPCRALAFGDGGKRLVSGGANRSVKVWDLTQKKEVATLREDKPPPPLPVPLAVAATPDRSVVALATENGVILLDGRTGERRGRITGHEDAVTCVAFTADGKTLATGSADKTIKLWEVATAKERFTLKGHSNWVYALAFAPDGKTLVTGSYDKTARFWETATGKELASLEAHSGSVRAVAFSADGKTLVTGGSDRVVKVWDADTRTLKHTLKGHRGSVRAVAVSVDGKVVASGGEDSMVRIWDPVEGKELFALRGHTDPVAYVAFAAPRTVVSGGTDGTIRTWDAAAGSAQTVLFAHQGGLTGLCALPGRLGLVSVGEDKIVKLWRPDAPGPVRLFTGHTGVVQSTAFSPDGKRFVSCGNWPEGDKTIRVWEVETGTELLKITRSDQTGMALFSPDGKYILSASSSGDVFLLDATTGKELKRFRGHTDWANGLAYSSDGKHFLSSGSDNTVRYWDVETGRELRRFEGHTDSVRRVAFHPDGKHALSAGRDGRVRMWELATGKEVKQFPASGKWSDCLAVTTDGKYLAVGGNTIRVFEIETRKQVAECVGHAFGLNEVAFSPDGKLLLSASYDGSARLWDRESGTELYRFRGHRDYLWSVAFSPDGKWILTAGGGNADGGKHVKGTDFAIRMWALPDAQTMAEFAPEN
jgi:WD40 repeat protein